ncbi:hypothetical protein HN011_012134 [Eciton burchellii]|nr:hypothetical protein HN011_012134 [Eciton burchellii]
MKGCHVKEKHVCIIYENFEVMSANHERQRPVKKKEAGEKRSENKKDPHHTEAATGGDSPEFPGDSANSSSRHRVIPRYELCLIHS